MLRNDKILSMVIVVMLAAACVCPAQPANNWQEVPPLPPGQVRVQAQQDAPGVATSQAQDPNSLLQQGAKLKQEQRFEEAAAAFLEIYKKYPDHVFAPNGLVFAADATDLAGRPADALRLYEVASDKYPDNVEVVNAHIKMSKLYERTGRPDDAVNAMKHVIKNGRDFEARNAAQLLVELYFRIDRVYEAQELSEKILRENPNDIQFLLNLAHSYETEKNYETAAGIFKNIMRVYPGNASYEYRLFNTLKLGGGLDEYIDELERERKKNPDDMAAVHRLARVLQWDDRSIDALVQLEVIVAHEPENYSDAVTLATLYYRNQWKTKARETLERVLEKKNNFEPALREMGNFYFHEEDIEKAKGFWQRAALFAPGDEGSYRRLANLMLPMGLYADAAELYEQGRAHFKNENLFSQELAYIYDKQMQKEKALREYIRLVEFAPEQQNWAGLILKLSREEGLEGVAENMLEAARSRRPSNPELKLITGEVYMVTLAPVEAIRRVKLLAGNDGDAAQFFVELAARRAGRGIVTHAAELYELAAGYPGPHRANALLRAGRSRLAAGQPERAEADFRLLSEEGSGAPGVDEALNLLAGIAEDDGRYGEARGMYARLAAEHPGSPWFEPSLVGEARCAFLSGDIARARESFDSLVKRAGSSRYFDEIMFYRAETRFMSMEINEARGIYGLIADQYPESRMVNDAISRMMFLEDAAEADPIHLQAFAAAEKMTLEGKYETAESVLNGLVITLEDETIRGHAVIALAELMIRMKRYEDAVNVLSGIPVENAGELAARAGYMAAQAYMELGRKEESLRKCQEVIAAHSRSYWARKARSLAASLADDAE